MVSPGICVKRRTHEPKGETKPSKPDGFNESRQVAGTRVTPPREKIVMSGSIPGCIASEVA